MKATYPAVQKNCKEARKIACISDNSFRTDKRNANRRHRRYLNRVTNAFVRDPDRFDREGFDAPTLSSWELC